MELMDFTKNLKQLNHFNERYDTLYTSIKKTY